MDLARHQQKVALSCAVGNDSAAQKLQGVRLYSNPQLTLVALFESNPWALFQQKEKVFQTVLIFVWLLVWGLKSCSQD